MNQLIKDKNFLLSNLNYFLIIILPITILAGSLVSNITIILISIFFILDLVQRKNNFILKDINFYFLLLIYFYLVFNSFFISENSHAPLKGLAFIRFILLSYAIFFYSKIFDYSFLKYWAIIFLIVSFDIVFEFFLGFNTIGYESIYIGRIASFTGDELKIGGFYFGFIFLSLAFFSKKKIFIPLLIIFLFISLAIGERSNFLKISIMYFCFFLFFANTSYFKKFCTMVIIFLLIFFVANQSQNLKAKYNFIDILNLNENIERLNNKDSFNSMVYENRYLIHYKIALNILKQNLFFGKGFKTYRTESYNEKYFDQSLEFSVGHGSTHPHQLHFEILCELGIIGYLLIISNFFYLLFKQSRLKKNFLTKGSILFLIATLVPLLPSGSFFTSYVATIFFINYAFLINTNIINNK